MRSIPIKLHTDLQVLVCKPVWATLYLMNLQQVSQITKHVNSFKDIALQYILQLAQSLGVHSKTFLLLNLQQVSQITKHVNSFKDIALQYILELAQSLGVHSKTFLLLLLFSFSSPSSRCCLKNTSVLNTNQGTRNQCKYVSTCYIIYTKQFMVLHGQ